jgi:glycosyltransferase involved in cell wall biosynthesis
MLRRTARPVFRNGSGIGLHDGGMLPHRLVAWAVRSVLRRGGRGRADGHPAHGAKVSILLMHAWGMGGTIRTTLNVAGHLAQRHEVEVISIVRRRDEPFFPFPPGVTVTAVDDQRPLPAKGLRRLVRRVLRGRRSRLMHPADRSHRACTLWTDLLLVRKLWRVRSGVLLATRPALNLLALDTARPGVVTVGEEHMNFPTHKPLMQAEIRRRYPGLDALVVLTGDDLRSYDDVLDGTTRLEQIPNAVPRLDGPASDLTRPVVLAAGRLMNQKGFDRLIPAFAAVARSHPEWTLRICGNGPKRRSLRKMIAEHGLEDNVVLAGAVSDMGAEMAGASMFVLSSRFEGLPMVMLEAMSKGLPVVSFDCPTGPREVIEDGHSGILVPQGDEEALGRAMLELVEDPERRARLGAAALARADDYSLGAIGPRWDELLASLDGAVVRRGAASARPRRRRR